MRIFLTQEEAWKETMLRTQVLGTEEVALADAYGRFWGKRVTAHAPFPSFDRSALDGYAVRAADVKNAPGGTTVYHGQFVDVYPLKRGALA